RTRNRENEISVRRWRSGGKSPRLDGQAIPKLLILLHGQVVEWLMAPHSKCGDPLRGSWVRIPPCPPVIFAKALTPKSSWQCPKIRPHLRPHFGFRESRPLARSMFAVGGCLARVSSGHASPVRTLPTSPFPRSTRPNPDEVRKC